MYGKPYQSILIPFHDEIRALRRRNPPMPCSQIAELLREKYQITVSGSNIYKYIKLRAQNSFKNKTCKYAWDMEPLNQNNQPDPEVPCERKHTVSHTPEINQTEVSDTLKPAVKVKDKPKQSVFDDSEPLPEFEYPFSDINNLRPLPPEEARALRKRYGLE